MGDVGLLEGYVFNLCFLLANIQYVNMSEYRDVCDKSIEPRADVDMANRVGSKDTARDQKVLVEVVPAGTSARGQPIIEARICLGERKVHEILRRGGLQVFATISYVVAKASNGIREAWYVDSKRDEVVNNLRGRPLESVAQVLAKMVCEQNYSPDMFWC